MRKNNKKRLYQRRKSVNYFQLAGDLQTQNPPIEPEQEIYRDGSPVLSPLKSIGPTQLPMPAMPGLTPPAQAAPPKKIDMTKLSNGIGAGLNVASGVMEIGSGMANSLKSVDVNSLYDPASATTKEGLATEAGNFGGADAGRESVGGKALSGAMAGAKAGMSFGPIGALVGGAAGAIGSGLASFFGNKKKEKAEQEANQR
jgi:hypothetical protein